MLLLCWNNESILQLWCGQPGSRPLRVPQGSLRVSTKDGCLDEGLTRVSSETCVRCVSSRRRGPLDPLPGFEQSFLFFFKVWVNHKGVGPHSYIYYLRGETYLQRCTVHHCGGRNVKKAFQKASSPPLRLNKDTYRV